MESVKSEQVEVQLRILCMNDKWPAIYYICTLCKCEAIKHVLLLYKYTDDNNILSEQVLETILFH